VNRDDIIRMALEAQLPYYFRTGEVSNVAQLERFAALVAAEEREQCAKVVDEAGYRYEFRANLPDHLRDITPEAGRIAPMVCLNVAANIRARGSNV
jgi:hypothetical protein